MAEASWKILVDVLLRERFLPDTVWPKLALSSKHLFGLAASEATRLYIEWHTYWTRHGTKRTRRRLRRIPRPTTPSGTRATNRFNEHRRKHGTPTGTRSSHHKLMHQSHVLRASIDSFVDVIVSFVNISMVDECFLLQVTSYVACIHVSILSAAWRQIHRVSHRLALSAIALAIPVGFATVGCCDGGEVLDSGPVAHRQLGCPFLRGEHGSGPGD